jgi:hypothetical protein
MQKQCKKVVRGSMFVHDKPDSDPGIICEECYQSHYYGREEYTKTYKHCILTESITPEMSRKICSCLGLHQDDTGGKPESLFPIDDPNRHKNTGIGGGETCKLLQLGNTIALAKYQGLLDSVGAKPRTLRDTEKAAIKAQGYGKKNFFVWPQHSAAKTEPGDSDFEEEEELRQKPEAQGSSRRLKAFKTGSYGSGVTVAEEAAADTDMPLFFRGYTEKHPYGNVHMALRVGPIVIENGVSQ